MSKTNANITIVVVCYYTGPSLWACLASCQKQNPAQIIIVNNGSSEKTARQLIQFQQDNSNTKLITGQGNIGFASACNLGAKQATGTHLMFLNPDAILQPSALMYLVEALKGQPVPSIAGARLLNEDGTEQRGARRGKLTPWSALVSMSGLTRFETASSLFTDMHWEHHPVPTKPQSVPAVSGACMMFRVKDFQQIGGFDERYFLHVEDLDICRQVLRKKGHVLFVPNAEIIHIGSTSKANIFLINWSKAKGLVRYFYRFSNSPIEKITAVVLAPFVVTAILVRTLILHISR